MEHQTFTDTEIERIAAQLVGDFDSSGAFKNKHPVKAVIIQIIKQLQYALFPGYFENGRSKNNSVKYRLCNKVRSRKNESERQKP